MAINISWLEWAAPVGTPSSRGSFDEVVCALSSMKDLAESNCERSGNRALHGESLGTESKAGIASTMTGSAPATPAPDRVHVGGEQSNVVIGTLASGECHA